MSATAKKLLSYKALFVSSNRSVTGPRRVTDKFIDLTASA